MDVRLPDGTVISNVPEGISKADLTAKLAANGYDVGQLQTPAKAKREAPSQPGLATAMSRTPVGQLLTNITTAGGIGSGMIKGFKEMTLDPLQNLSAAALHRMGVISDEQLKQYSAEQQAAKQQYEAQFRPSPVGEFIGAMAVPLPGSKIAAGSKLARIGKSAAQGALMGGAAAAGTGDVSSEDYGGDVTKGVALGAAIAPAFAGLGNVLGQTAQGASRFIRNRLTDAAQEDFLYRLVESNPQLGAKTASDIRAGQVPSAAPYAHAMETLPEIYHPTEFVERLRAKSKQFVSMLSNIGAKVPIANLEARREAKTAPLWNKVDRTRFKSDDTLESILSRYNETVRTSAPASIATIRKQQPAIGEFVPEGLYPVTGASGKPLVAASGQPIMQKKAAEYPEYLGSWLSDIRKDMAARIKGEVPEQAIASNLRGAVIGLRNELTEWMTKNSKDYKTALNTHRRYGKLIDQKLVAEHLRNVLSNAVDEGKQVSGAAFMNALDNITGTLKRATGATRYESLGELFNKKEMADVNRIGQSIAHQAHLEQRAMSGGAAGVRPAIEDTPGSHLLMRQVSILEGMVKAIGKHISEGAKKEIAGEMMRDPMAAANRLEAAIGKSMSREQKSKFITDATNTIRQTVKKPIFQQLFSKPSDAEQDSNELNVRYNADQAIRNAPPVQPAPQAPGVMPMDIYDMGEDYGVVPQVNIVPE